MRTKFLLLSIVLGLLIITRLGTADQRAPDTFTESFVKAVLERTKHFVRYDGSYRKIDYPMGDVPDHVGVCTDVVIRSYRALGIDLQQLVHEDMRSHFSAYPPLWGLSRPDPNIDHRRVPNLQCFFKRHGTALTISTEPQDYHAGHIVTWMLPGNLPHIGIVTGIRNTETNRPLIVHNIGAGPRLEDMLFAYPITGLYRFDDRHMKALVSQVKKMSRVNTR